MGAKQKIKEILAPLAAPFYKGKGQILMLHRIVPASGEMRIHNTVNEITPEKLEELLTFYKRHNVDIISLDDVGRYLSEKRRYFVVFTFDDGYRDNLTLALPVFQRYNVPFTVYITTGFSDRTISIWWYQLENILLENEEMSFKWGNQSYEFNCADKEQKESVFNTIRRMIIDTPYVQQRQYVESAFEQYVSDPFLMTEKLAMSWEEVSQLAASPLVTIGAHTLNHAALNQLSEDEVRDECMGSKELLDDKIGKPIQHFSYPFGSAREIGKRECAIVRKCGFKTATTTRLGSIFSEHRDHLHALPRIPISPHTTFDYLHRIIKGSENFIRGSQQRVVTV